MLHLHKGGLPFHRGGTVPPVEDTMPDSEKESKHFFQKVFRLQLFVSIVGLAEAVPAGLQGPLRLVAPHDPPGGVQSTAPALP